MRLNTVLSGYFLLAPRFISLLGYLPAPEENHIHKGQGQQKGQDDPLVGDRSVRVVAPLNGRRGDFLDFPGRRGYFLVIVFQCGQALGRVEPEQLGTGFNMACDIGFVGEFIKTTVFKVLQHRGAYLSVLGR